MVVRLPARDEVARLDRVRFAPAKLSSRIIAVGVDVLLGTCAMLIALVISSQKGLTQIQSAIMEDRRIPEDLEFATLLMLGVGLAMPFLFAIQVARQGATPGKALMSLTVRSIATGGFPNYPRALGREALRFLHIAPLLIMGELQVVLAALMIGVIFDMSRTRLSQTWYDRVLRTVIVAPIIERE
jgi:uncharacterized RDD family membrane protein YckC